MIGLFMREGPRPAAFPPAARGGACKNHLKRVACGCAIAALLAAGATTAQITVNTKTGTVTNGSTGKTIATIDRRYQQVEPTHIALTNSELDAKTRLELIRLLQSEQGFAMRPFPRGHKGLTLQANGTLDPAGEGYLEMVTAEGLSAKPGDRVVLTDVKIERSRIIFQLNGGPDVKHRFLRHIQIGTGPSMSPVVQDSEQDPVGARLTLNFKDHVPELNGSEVKALLAPLISFDVKTPVQAFTDTLPTKLKEAILNHHVLVGMTTDMVLFAKGQPDSKSREVDGQMPFEEWIYGKPPHEVEFVRINGNLVIRLEVAKIGETPVIFTNDEVQGLMRTDGTPLEPGGGGTRVSPRWATSSATPIRKHRLRRPACANRVRPCLLVPSATTVLAPCVRCNSPRRNRRLSRTPIPTAALSRRSMCRPCRLMPRSPAQPNSRNPASSLELVSHGEFPRAALM